MSFDSRSPAPLTRAEALDELVRSGESSDGRQGHFLSFVMIPLEERIGEWRFAGASESLGGAFRRVGEFADAMGFPNPEGTGFLRNLLSADVVEFRIEPGEVPFTGVGPHRIVILGEGQAPYDDSGICVVEVPSLGEYANRQLETNRPEEWS